MMAVSYTHLDVYKRQLLPYESCNLGSINLVKMLAKTPEGYAVDYGLLRDTVRQAIHFLDNVIDVNNYPLEQILSLIHI